MAAQRAQRRSAREIEARRQARERNAKVRAREQRLEDLATDFFLAGSEIEDAEERAQTRLREYAARVAEETQAATGPLRSRQAHVVHEMLELARIGAVAERLGEPRDVITQFRDAPVRGEPSSAVAERADTEGFGETEEQPAVDSRGGAAEQAAQEWRMDGAAHANGPDSSR